MHYTRILMKNLTVLRNKRKWKEHKGENHELLKCFSQILAEEIA